MKGKKILAGILSAVMALGTMAVPAFAEETTMTYAEFLKKVADNDYNYDGNNVKVTIKTNCGCKNDQHTVETCPNNYAAATAETPDRIDKDKRAQYYLFNGVEKNVTIKNVQFVADITEGAGLCANTGYAGKLDAGSKFFVELQFLNYGSLTIDGCSFDNICLAPYHKGGESKSDAYTDTIKNSKFNNVYNTYGIATVSGGTIVVEKNEFKNCSGGIWVWNGNVGGITIDGNKFETMGTNGASDKQHTRGLIQLAAEVPATTDVIVKNNTSDGSTPIFWQLSGVKSVCMQNNNFGTASTYTSNTKEDKYLTINPVNIGETAYPTLQNAVNNAAEGAEIVLNSDVEMDKLEIAEGKSVTIDLNGKTLKFILAASGTDYNLVNNGTLTIKDSSEGKTGTVTHKNPNVTGYYLVENNGTMTIDGGNFVYNTGDNTTKWHGSAMICNVGTATKTATMTINNGYFKQDWFIAVKNDDYAELTIHGGTFETKASKVRTVGDKTEEGTIDAVQNWSTATINGGTFNGPIGGWVYEDNFNSTTTITDGTFNCPVKSNVYYTYTGNNRATVSISGGIFKYDVDEYAVAGKGVTKQDGVYKVLDKVTAESTKTEISESAQHSISQSFGTGEDGAKTKTDAFSLTPDNGVKVVRASYTFTWKADEKQNTKTYNADFELGNLEVSNVTFGVHLYNIPSDVTVSGPTVSVLK